MEITSTVNKLLAPVEKHGKLIGAGLELLQQVGVLGGGSNVPLMDSISRLLAGNVHMPEWGNIISYATGDTNTKNALVAMIAGYIGKDITGNRWIDGTLELAYKVGYGYFVTNMLAAGLYYSTHSDSGGVSSMPQQTGGYTINPTYGGSTLNQVGGNQNLSGVYQSVYPSNPTAGNLYTVNTERLVGN